MASLKYPTINDAAHIVTEQDLTRIYSHWYACLRDAAENLTVGLEAVHFCAQNNFTLQYPVLLSPLRRKDSEQEIRRKLRVVSSYLDILITRRIWNWRAIDYSSMQYTMFVTMREIRHKDVSALVEFLSKRLVAEEETFATNELFRLHGTNRTANPSSARSSDRLL